MEKETLPIVSGVHATLGHPKVQTTHELYYRSRPAELVIPRDLRMSRRLDKLSFAVI